jgi:hypothetical protein
MQTRNFSKTYSMLSWQRFMRLCSSRDNKVPDKANLEVSHKDNLLQGLLLLVRAALRELHLVLVANLQHQDRINYQAHKPHPDKALCHNQVVVCKIPMNCVAFYRPGLEANNLCLLTALSIIKL